MSTKTKYEAEIAYNSFYKDLHKNYENKKYGKQITNDIRTRLQRSQYTPYTRQR